MVYGYESEDSPRRRRGPLRRLWHLIKWPFRTVERIETALVKWFNERRRKFRHKYRHSKVIAPLVGLLVTIALAPFRLVWFLLSAPFRLFGQTASQFGKVRGSRQWMHLLQGLPAVVVLAGVFVVLMKLTMQRDELPQRYREQAEKAYRAENYERARLYLQRVLQLGSDTDPTSLLLARTLQKTGQPERSAAILDSLAPENELGYPDAHLWKAASLANDPATFESNDRIEALKRHLKIASTSIKLSDDPDFQYYSFVVKSRIGRQQEAFEHLERAVHERAGLNYELAMSYLYLDPENPRRDLAEPALARASAHLREELNRNPQDYQTRERLARTLAELGQHEEMERILQEGISLKPDGNFQAALANEYVIRCTMLPTGNAPAERLAMQVDLLQKALELDPGNKNAFNELINLFGNGRSDEHTRATRSLLESLIAVGRSAPFAHFVIGINDFNAGSIDDALWNMERAYKLDPTIVVVANNYAWLLANNEKNPDPERALEVINSVIERNPAPDYLETRGQIFVKLERWEEALDDLQQALPELQGKIALDDTIALHESLAVVYEHLGQSGLAEKHERVAAALKQHEAPKR